MRTKVHLLTINFYSYDFLLFKELIKPKQFDPYQAPPQSQICFLITITASKKKKPVTLIDQNETWTYVSTNSQKPLRHKRLILLVSIV